jgi:hypothetical protein
MNEQELKNRTKQFAIAEFISKIGIVIEEADENQQSQI